MQTTAMAEMGIDNLMASVGDTPNEETRKAPNLQTKIRNRQLPVSSSAARITHDPNALLLKEKANE
jgi:hypothetical protein